MLFDGAVSEFNAKQKRSDRKKNDSYFVDLFNREPCQTVVTATNKEKSFYEDVVQIGKMEDTAVGTADAEVAKECLIEYMNGFQKRNPQFYVFNAVLHMDEATPHLHIDYIPVAKGYKTGLSVRNGLAKALEQMGYGKNKDNISKWRDAERKVFRDICVSKGIEVSQEIKGEGREYIPIPEYKEIKKKECDCMENNDLIKQTEKTFEEIKHIDENGVEFWYAREFMNTLTYKSWRYFENVIEKAMIACKDSQMLINEHFVVYNKTLQMPNNATKNITDYKLTRYACYLIAQNANPHLKVVALAQTYFAVQTRKQELTREQYNQLSEDEKRLYTRKNVSDRNKFLYETAKNSGVTNYGKFTNYGYKGLYNGETAKDIAKRKGIDPKKEEILDYMDSTELAANLFRITQTDEVLKNKQVNNEAVACQTHHDVGQAVRQVIKRIGGTMPEDSPTPQKSTKQLEKEKRLKLKASSNNKKK